MTLRQLVIGAAAVVLTLAAACRSDGPQGDGGSQTNWLMACESSAMCGDLECLCGICTLPCGADAECSALGGVCVDGGEEQAVAVCDGARPPTDLCLAPCVDGACSEGTVCVAGVCTPSREPTATVAIDPERRYQALIGFGASLAHDEELMLDHPDRERLFDVMFSESGFDAIRMRNRYEPGNDAALEALVEIVSEASARLGHSPALFMASGSPPASLKANGARACPASDVNCTLVRNADGNFDYAGFAEHWRAALDAYEALGIHPDYVSIQSNPDWNPQDDAVEACHFLPQEGLASVTTPDGEVTDVEFAGYAEAMAAVVASVGTLPASYSFFGPEVGNVAALADYAAIGEFDGLAYHLYDVDADAVVEDAFEQVSSLSARSGKRSIQSAMRADGLGTAILAHHALALADSAGYFQQQFVTPTFTEGSTALVGANESTVEKLPAYHALFHFARFTDPGWMRIAATSDSDGVLATAWLSPDGSALTVVLVNPTEAPADVRLTEAPAEALVGARVLRTVFDGVERSAALGVLSESNVVRLPGRAIVTVTTANDP